MEKYRMFRYHLFRWEQRRISRRVGNLYRHHCCKTTNDLIQICAEPIRRYVSLIQAERKLDSDNIKLKELEMSLLMVNISQY
ncbi:hypothetical protein LSH36_471g01036 [Paralvinella palmiformis]|uniref:Uncharacterized protein n=1 Tax=Paralvinella palmiformis TaxID=53620 RepID=A0AAD9J9J5_9ANNE|nr:hypothetical protein LSH36_471g01036 [Paralvinella palmiformis]